MVVTWPVDDEFTLHRMLGMGVNGIISNQPEVLATVTHAHDHDRGRE